MIVIPIENHPTNIPHCMVLIKSIRDTMKEDVIIVNHNNSKLPQYFIDFLKNETLLNISLTNNKYYYKKQCYFLLKCEVLKYIADNYKPPYCLIDPDNIVLKDFKGEGNIVFKTPMDISTELIMSLFVSYPENLNVHYNTQVIFSDNKEFIYDWYNNSHKIAQFGINHPNKIIGNRFQHYCEELGMTLTAQKHQITNNKVIDAYLGNDVKTDCAIYHYDYAKILKQISKKYYFIYHLFGKDNDENRDMGITINNKDKIKQELIDFTDNNILSELSQETKNVLHIEEYDFGTRI